MYSKKSPTHTLRNSSSDDSGIYCTDIQYYEDEAELLRKLQLEEEDNLTPLKKIQRKPLSYYKKQANKPSVKNLINKYDGNNETTHKKDSKNNAKTHMHQPNTYQTTFIRIWPSDYADVRC